MNARLSRGSRPGYDDRLNSHGPFSVFESYMARIGFDHVSSTILNRA